MAVVGGKNMLPEVEGKNIYIIHSLISCNKRRVVQTSGQVLSRKNVQVLNSAYFNTLLLLH